MASQHDPRKALGLMLLLVVAGAGASAGVSFMGQTVGVSETKVQFAVVVPAEDFSEADVSLQQALVETSRNGSTFGVSFEAGGGKTFNVSLPLQNRADVEVLTQLNLKQTDGAATLSLAVEPSGFDNTCDIANTTSLAPSNSNAWEFHMPATCKDHVRLEVSVPSTADRDFYRIVGTLDAQGDDEFVGTLTDAGDATLSSPTPTSGNNLSSADNVSKNSGSLLTGERDIVQFKISSTSNVSIERFGFETQNDLANVTQSGAPHRFNVTGITQNASRDNATAFVYDNTTYTFDQSGVLNNETGTVTLDAVNSSPIEIHGFVTDRTSADLIVRLGYGDGSSTEVYLDASLPSDDTTETTTSADNVSVDTGSLLTGEQEIIQFNISSTGNDTLERFAFESQNDLADVSQSGEPHRFNVTGINKTASRDNATAFVYDNTTYTFTQTGVIDNESGTVTLDSVHTSPIEIHGFVPDRTSADLIVRLGYRDGSSDEVYLNASLPTSDGAESLAAVYAHADSGRLRMIEPDGSVSAFDTDQVQAISPASHDLDSDGRVEIAYINNSNHLRLIDRQNETTTLNSSGNAGDESSGTSLGIGDWDDDSTAEIVYTHNGYLYEVEFGGSSSKILDANGNPIPVGSIAGIADFDDDGAQDIVFVEPDNNEIRFLDQPGDQVQTMGVFVDSIEAISTPADYDDDGTIEVAYVDGNADIQLVDKDGNDGSAIDPGYDVVSTALGGVDWTGDGHPDLIHLDNNNQELVYWDEINLETGHLNNADGQVVHADNNFGVQ